MSRSLDDLQPEVRERCQRLLELAALEGIVLKVVHTLRTMEEQALLYQKGRSRPGPKVTNARPGYSFHNFGLAFDVAFGDPLDPKVVKWTGPWKRVGELGRSLSLKWGGDWKMFVDKPHFEFTGGKTLKQLRQEAGIS